MNITKMTDEELAKELDRHFDVKPAQLIEVAQFIRKCVKDSMPTEDEIAKILLRWDSVIADSELARDMAHALRMAMEGSNA